MTISGWNDPAEEERNPHRTEERRHAREELESRLLHRRITITGDESDDEILAISNAVEDFEARLARIGADSFTNSVESSEPDEQRFVLPERRADETGAAYAERVRAAANALR